MHLRQVKAAYERGDGLQPDLMPTPAGAAIPRGGIVDLTSRMDSAGRLSWEVPEGEWTILRIGHTPTMSVNAPAPPEGRGLECDKLSREAMDAHWAGMMAAVLKDAGPLAGRTLNNVLIDSYEVGSQNWTPRFREEFRRRRGYDPLLFLPVVTGRVVDSIETSERFLWDLRRTVCDLFADNYFGYFGDLCHKNGLKFSTEVSWIGATSIEEATERIRVAAIYASENGQGMSFEPGKKETAEEASGEEVAGPPDPKGPPKTGGKPPSG